MAQGGGEETWSTTVIGHDVATSLQSQHHKVRYSESVESGSIIFSLSGVAFLLANAQDLFVTSREALFDRVEKFISVHRNCFLVIAAALHGPNEWNLMFNIQQRFLGSNLRIIPVHNSADTVKMILTIAKQEQSKRRLTCSRRVRRTTATSWWWWEQSRRRLASSRRVRRTTATSWWWWEQRKTFFTAGGSRGTCDQRRKELHQKSEDYWTRYITSPNVRD
ncbi:protein SPO16 homolog isoform X2 [Ascaphus truei]|uniref:protein SPO16 homolog isoform X2 n=1 Tax=Ascaphus truei TaxID=8439 RepID=UPI003F59A07F